MKFKRTTRMALVLMMLALPAAAQYGNEDGTWQLNGSLGFSLFRNSNTPVVQNAAETDVNRTMALDFRSMLSGFLRDPKLLRFDAAVDGERGFNSLNYTGAGVNNGFDNSLLNYAFNTFFLPTSHYPLRLWYSAGNSDLTGKTGSVFSSFTDRQQYGFEWELSPVHLPHFLVRELHNQNNVRLAESLNDTSYKQNDWSFQANDSIAGWSWNAGYNFGSNDVRSLGTIGINSNQDYNTLELHALKRAWHDRGLLSLEHRSEDFSYGLGAAGSTDSSDLRDSATFQFAVTPKLTTSSYYTFEHVTATTNLVQPVGSISAGTTNFSSDSHAAGGEVDYRIWKPITIFENVRYIHSTPIADLPVETIESGIQSDSGVRALTTWKRIELSGTYTGRFDHVGTSFDHQLQTWSNSFSGRAAWGNVQRVRLSGNVDLSALNTVEQVGGYDKLRRYFAQVETTHIPGYRLTFTAGRSNIELLSFSGLIDSSYTDFSARVDHRRFSAGVGQHFSDGSGGLFPTSTGLHQISDPLPVAQLFVTPLLNHTGRIFNAYTSLYLKRNLEIDVNYQREHDLFFATTQNYRLFEAVAKYRIGKITIDAGYGRYFNETVLNPGLSGLRANRLYFRIWRDFRFF